MAWGPYVLLFLDPVLCIVLEFLKNLKHIILGADYMKKISLLTMVVCAPRQTAAWWYYIKLLHIWERDKLFEINFNSNESSQPLRDHPQISFVTLNGSNWIEYQPRLNEKYKPALYCISILRRDFCE